MLGLILSSVIKESTFLKVLRSVITGLKLFGGLSSRYIQRK